MVSGTLTPLRTNAASPAPDLPELGAPGTQFWRGFLKTDEYVPELTGTRALDVYERMRRSDAMVKGALYAVKAPILSAEWTVRPGSSTPRDREIADRFAWNLFEGMSMTWRDHLRQALTHLEFGFYVCEIVWALGDQPAPTTVLEMQAAHALEDGERRLPGRRVFYVWSGTFAASVPMYKIKKLAPRLQRTVTFADLAPDGGIRTVKQQIWGGESARRVDIPVEKLLVFTHDKDGANWTGTSILRAAYRDWFLKDHKMRFQGIQAERHAIGIPVMKLPPGKDDPSNITRAENILMGVRTHERAYVVLPDGYEFSIVGMDEGRLLDLIPHLQYHDRQIAMAVLAPQLTLGANPEGSNALSNDQSSFFMLTEKAIAEHIADIHNRYLIPQWVRFNYGEVDALPQLEVGRIETRNLDKIWNALAIAAGQQLITPDDVLESRLREDAGLPPRDPATERKRLAPAPAPQPQPAGQKPGTEPPPAPAADGAVTP